MLPLAAYKLLIILFTSYFSERVISNCNLYSLKVMNNI